MKIFKQITLTRGVQNSGVSTPLAKLSGVDTPPSRYNMNLGGHMKSEYIIFTINKTPLVVYNTLYSFLNALLLAPAGHSKFKTFKKKFCFSGIKWSDGRRDHPAFWFWWAGQVRSATGEASTSQGTSDLPGGSQKFALPGGSQDSDLPGSPKDGTQTPCHERWVYFRSFF